MYKHVRYSTLNRKLLMCFPILMASLYEI